MATLLKCPTLAARPVAAARKSSKASAAAPLSAKEASFSGAALPIRAAGAQIQCRRSVSVSASSNKPIVAASEAAPAGSFLGVSTVTLKKARCQPYTTLPWPRLSARRTGARASAPIPVRSAPPGSCCCSRAGGRCDGATHCGSGLRAGPSREGPARSALAPTFVPPAPTTAAPQATPIVSLLLLFFRSLL